MMRVPWTSAMVDALDDGSGCWGGSSTHRFEALMEFRGSGLGEADPMSRRDGLWWRNDALEHSLQR